MGTSIGAINAAIAAGNPEKIRTEKLYQFWESIATPTTVNLFELFDDPISRHMAHFFSAHSSLFFGQPGFFVPRLSPPELFWHNSPGLLSYYDTSPLRSTLEKFVDFDRVNSSKVTRLSVGSVEISSGEMVYFDSFKEKIGPEHIMASGALPPGFPAVEIQGKFYWDGGLSNNSPVGYVLGNNDQRDLLCFMVNLFNSYGLNPSNMDEIIKRKKDIEFASKFNRIVDLYKEVHELKNSIHKLSKFVPEQEKSNQKLKKCVAKGTQSQISLVHFSYSSDDSELSSKDFEFSPKTIKERIDKGYRDGKNAIKKSPWLQKSSSSEGIRLHEMSPVNPIKKGAAS